MLQIFYSATETVAPVVAQASTTPPNLVLTVLASAFGGATLTSFVSIWSKKSEIKADRQKRTEDEEAERQRWIRGEKLSVYSKFATVARSCMNDAGVSARVQNARDSRNELVAMNSLLRLLASEQIAKDAVAHSIKLKQLIGLRTQPDKFQEVREIVRNDLHLLLEEMQRDLGIKTKP
ncbi:hypothetical protein [Paeniglutamicibacter psychrophenolicus]|uniref:hypothetical protein n=1 Tax=Paeniglutamicibacter psychrophenolicus TaxID=257454 RepID=UPI002780F0C0|nr:hypothetical protein [Paeniglutamicibacter psychrophenolicus]MDQ0093457.1 hypothetical protein [Paeniglutamicibacter psychrophenolicus]